jgi:hypothetical protein
MNRTILQTTFARRASLAMFLCLFALLLVPGTSNACNRSYLQLDSTVATGTGEWDIYVTACVGAGITGYTKGAGANTYTFGFVFYSSCVPALNISYFPPSVKGDVTNAAYTGYNFGPVGPPFSAQAALLYLNPSYQPFVCVNTTAACGNVHTQCNQFRFRVADMPDSLRVLGYEGAGNSMGGCYANADMMVVLPAVGNPCNRVAGGAINPPANATQPDPNTIPDHEQFFPNAAESATASPEFSLFPNPNPGRFVLKSGDPSHQIADVTVHDLAGREVASLRSVRMGETIDLGQLPTGSYFLRASGDDFNALKMFVVQ